jgi:type III pantothenate kinase
MKYLLLDIGNSNIKAGVTDKNGVIIHSVKRSDYDKNNLTAALGTLLSKYKGMNFDKSGISIVDSKLKDELNEYVIKNITKENIFVDINHKCGIKFRYEKTLGSDRVAAAAGAYFNYNDYKNILIVDFGTATTYSILSDGVYLGGIITPGLFLTHHALINNTDLPDVELNSKYDFLNSCTKDAIRSGILLNAKMSFEGIVSGYENIYNDLIVIATGGGTALMKKISDKIELIDENLVLKGILKILNYYN